MPAGLAGRQTRPEGTRQTRDMSAVSAPAFTRRPWGEDDVSLLVAAAQGLCRDRPVLVDKPQHPAQPEVHERKGHGPMMTRIDSNCQLKGMIQVMAPFTSSWVGSPGRRPAMS